jgi:hypothetical protein
MWPCLRLLPACASIPASRSRLSLANSRLSLACPASHNVSAMSISSPVCYEPEAHLPSASWCQNIYVPECQSILTEGPFSSSRVLKRRMERMH